MAVGLGLASKLVHQHWRRERAADNLHRILRHTEREGIAPSNPGSLAMWYSPWVIHNPIHPSGFWPYGGAASALFGATFRHWVSCHENLIGGSGNLTMLSAQGMAATTSLLTAGYNSTNAAGSLIINNRVSPMQNIIYWLSQFGAFDRDWQFCSTYAAFAKNWRIFPPYIPATALFNVNTTQAALVSGSMSGITCRGPIHVPLIYRLQYHGVNGGLGTLLNAATGNSWSYQQILNDAPPCGPYLYSDGAGGPPSAYANLEWSVTDRLHEFYHRWSGTLVPENYGCSDYNQVYHTEFNGVDYLLLFNLFTLVQPGALTRYFNSYSLRSLARNSPTSPPEIWAVTQSQ